MKVVSFKICPFVQRVTALLEARNIPYEVEFISLKNKPQWFLDISPNGQVPVLITENGTPIFESDAIVEYLDEVFPAEQPNLSAEDRASNRAWSYLASKNYLVQCSAQRSPDAETLGERGKKLTQAFDRVETQLGEYPYFGGETVGMVDIAWLPLLHRAEIIERRTGFDFVGDHPKVKQWQSQLLATGIAEKSVARDFEDAFSDFYLSEETFLGRGYDMEPGEVSKACCSSTCCQG